MNTDSRQEPAANKSANNPDQEIADQSEAGPSNNLTGQPTRYYTDYNDDEETFT